MFGSKSASLCDSRTLGSKPSSSSACSRPAKAVWLNEWSSTPPVSVTWHAEKSTLSPPPAVVSEVSPVVSVVSEVASSSSSPHAAATRDSPRANARGFDQRDRRMQFSWLGRVGTVPPARAVNLVGRKLFL